MYVFYFKDSEDIHPDFKNNKLDSLVPIWIRKCPNVISILLSNLYICGNARVYLINAFIFVEGSWRWNTVFRDIRVVKTMLHVRVTNL